MRQCLKTGQAQQHRDGQGKGERKQYWSEVGEISSEQEGKIQRPGEDQGREETARVAGDLWGEKTLERTRTKQGRSAALLPFCAQQP